jgi:hypothetical protein
MLCFVPFELIWLGNRRTSPMKMSDRLHRVEYELFVMSPTTSNEGVVDVMKNCVVGLAISVCFLGCRGPLLDFHSGNSWIRIYLQQREKDASKMDSWYRERDGSGSVSDGYA